MTSFSTSANRQPDELSAEAVMKKLQSKGGFGPPDEYYLISAGGEREAFHGWVLFAAGFDSHTMYYPLPMQEAVWLYITTDWDYRLVYGYWVPEKDAWIARHSDLASDPVQASQLLMKHMSTLSMGPIDLALWERLQKIWTPFAGLSIKCSSE